MSDPAQADAPNPAPAESSAPAPAPAESVAAASVAAAPASTPSSSPSVPAPGAFGSTRGSGLARGKRPVVASSSASAPAVPTGFKPSSLEVITPKSEYKNPFTGETAVNTPRAHEPVPPPQPPAPVAPEPVAVQPAAPAAPTPVAAPEAPTPAAAPAAAPESAEKAELKILPPETARRAEVRWEAAPAAGEAAGGPAAPEPRREERGTFQPARERREPREPRSFDPREPREPRRDDRRFEPRTNPPSRGAPIPFRLIAVRLWPVYSWGRVSALAQAR